MNEVKWIKITTDIFDDEKILLIESLPEADTIIVIWFKLLCLSGKQNNGGVFMMNDKIAYTDKMLATIFRRSETIVQLALQTFEQFGMIERINDVVTIPNWNKHQNIEGLDKIREQTRLRVAKYRENQKQLPCNVSVTLRNDIDKDIDIKKEDKDIYKDNGNKTKRFVKPTLEEITNYISENNLNVNAQYWFDYYESNGWKVGKNPMKDWKACIRRWNKTEMSNLKSSRQKVVYTTDEMQVEELDAEALRNQLFGGNNE